LFSGAGTALVMSISALIQLLLPWLLNGLYMGDGLLGK